jgi:enoyl-CoA hydratase
MSYKTILVEESEGIVTLTFNRPEKLNALNGQVLDELEMAVEAFAGGEGRALILTGKGKSFVAGADIAFMSRMNAVEALAFADQGQRILWRLGSMDKPVAAAINGFALGGGCEIAMACDLVYASTQARIGQPEVKLGIIPGFGGTQRLARLVGLAKSKELVFTGDTLGAEEARRIGLVCDVFEPGQLIPRTREAMGRIMANGPVAVAQAKRAMALGVDLPLASALELEKQCFVALFGTEDQREGTSAFVDKRKPEFRGK